MSAALDRRANTNTGNPEEQFETATVTLNIAISNLETLLNHPAAETFRDRTKALANIRGAKVLLEPVASGGTASVAVLKATETNLRNLDSALQSWVRQYERSQGMELEQ